MTGEHPKEYRRISAQSKECANTPVVSGIWLKPIVIGRHRADEIPLNLVTVVETRY